MVVKLLSTINHQEPSATKISHPETKKEETETRNTEPKKGKIRET
jgi:hypothetical protein